MGSPGVWQALQLRLLLDQRNATRTKLEKEMTAVEDEVSRLEKNAFVQERQIRRVLGYTGADEIVFDFASSPTNAPRLAGQTIKSKR